MSNSGHHPEVSRRMGGAIQHILRRVARVDGCAMDAPPSPGMQRGHAFAFSRRGAPEVDAIIDALAKQEGAGKAGCPEHPQIVRKNAHGVTAGAPEHPAFPAQWFYGLCRALPGAEFLWPPSLTDWRLIEARSGPTISISLTPATGARTTRFCRPQLPRAKRLDRPVCCRPKIPAEGV